MEIVNENTRTSKVPPSAEGAQYIASNTLKTFLTGELKDIYWAEQKLVQTLPKMAEACSSDALRSLFNKHLVETQQHVKRLEKVFAYLGMPPEAVKCEAMAGLVEEGEGIINDTPAGSATRDVGLILAAQKVEHYEMATYGGLVQIALILGLQEVSGLLNATLDEEKGADKMLSLAASSDINRLAAKE